MQKVCWKLVHWMSWCTVYFSFWNKLCLIYWAVCSIRRRNFPAMIPRSPSLVIHYGDQAFPWGRLHSHSHRSPQSLPVPLGMCYWKDDTIPALAFGLVLLQQALDQWCQERHFFLQTLPMASLTWLRSWTRSWRELWGSGYVPAKPTTRSVLSQWGSPECRVVTRASSSKETLSVLTPLTSGLQHNVDKESKQLLNHFWGWQLNTSDLY